MSGRHAVSEDSEEESVLASSWLLGVVILTLLGLHHGTQSLSPHGLLLCLSGSSPLLIRTLVIVFQAHSNSFNTF